MHSIEFFCHPTDLDDLFLKAAKDVINEQIALEIDVITDGEVRRENYTYYLW